MEKKKKIGDYMKNQNTWFAELGMGLREELKLLRHENDVTAPGFGDCYFYFVISSFIQYMWLYSFVHCQLKICFVWLEFYYNQLFKCKLNVSMW